MSEAPGVWNDPRKLDLMVAAYILAMLVVAWFLSQPLVTVVGYGVLGGVEAGVVLFVLFLPAILLALRRQRILRAALAKTR